jgi:hypothetical protein
MAAATAPQISQNAGVPLGVSARRAASATMESGPAVPAMVNPG